MEHSFRVGPLLRQGAFLRYEGVTDLGKWGKQAIEEGLCGNNPS